MPKKGRIDRRKKFRPQPEKGKRAGPSRPAIRMTLLLCFIVAAILIIVVVLTSPRWYPDGGGGNGHNGNPPPPTYPKPTPSASAVPATVFVGQNVTFDASRSTAYSGAYITNFTWEFHYMYLDAPVSMRKYERKFNLSFDKAGEYFIVLFVTDSRGLTNNSISVNKYNAKVVLVNSRNLVAEAGPDVSIPVGKAVSFNASGSYDKNGTIVNYTWDFGDKTKGYGVAVSHIYNAKGVYIVNMTIRDDHGETLMDTLNVVVG